MERKNYLAGEIFLISKRLGIPISRSLLHLYRKQGKFQAVAEYMGNHVYSRATVIKMLENLAKVKGKIVYREDIEAEMEATENEKALYN